MAMAALLSLLYVSTGCGDKVVPEPDSGLLEVYLDGKTITLNSNPVTLDHNRVSDFKIESMVPGSKGISVAQVRFNYPVRSTTYMITGVFRYREVGDVEALKSAEFETGSVTEVE